MGPKKSGAASTKGKADDAKSTKSKVSQRKRPPSVAKSQISKAENAEVEDVQQLAPSEKVKSQTSQRYEEQKDEEEVVDNQPKTENLGDEANENVDDDDDLGLKEQTTKGIHLESELNGLQSMHGTMKNAQLDDADGLILEEGVQDNATDYKAKQDVKSEIADDLGILQDKEEIQPVIKNCGVSDENGRIVTDSWNELLKKGELNIGKVLIRNLFQIKPETMKLFTSEENKDVKVLFTEKAFLEEIQKIITAIKEAVQNIFTLDSFVPTLIDLGETLINKGVLQEYYKCFGRALQLTLKAGLRDKFSDEVSHAVDTAYNAFSSKMQYEWYTNEALRSNDLTEERVAMVQGSWANAKDLGYEAVGDQLFQNIFAAAPEALQLFSFGAHANYRETDKYKDHTVKVASTLSTAVENLQKLDELAPILKNLGADHVPRGVQKAHYPVVMNAVVKTLQDNLGSDFNPHVKKAWRVVLNVVQETMIGDHYDDGDLTQEVINLVQSTWAIAKTGSFEEIGDTVFQYIFQERPDLQSLLSFGHDPDYRNSQSYKEHNVRFITTFSAGVEGLNNMDEVTPILQKLGLTHMPRGVKKEDYPVAVNATLKTLADGLGSKFTPDVRKAWNVVLNKFTGIMISSYDDMLPEDAAEQLLSPDNMPGYHKEDTYRNMDSYAITVQNTERDLRMQQSMRSDRNEDTMRPINEKNEMLDQEGLTLAKIGTQKTQLERNEIVDNYAQLFRSEVDFHHKVAYRFEKAYRLGKKVQERKQSLNLEIIDCISEHSGYIEQDPMALFYCLFFCCYYKNEDLVEFLRQLIHKIHSHEKIDKLLEYIDQEGIEKIRTVGEQINQIVYHMVFYQAIDDNLRIVYSSILRQLKLVQFRDKDALHLLNNRDYELIDLTFTLITTKIDMNLFYKPEEAKNISIKASTYRRYNQAYYEEIVITSGNVEERVSQNYRERFLVTANDIYTVFQMYCKEDYYDEFIQTKKDEITHEQFVTLFIQCVKNDSFKIGMLIYTMYLNIQVDIDQALMDIVMTTIRDSTLFHELKLFLIHEHFDILSIEQMNHLVDVYQDILHAKEPKGNPLISQYNSIKVSLLIYRICWKIEKKQIYSLITKCQLLQHYIIKSLQNFFERCNNILILYKFMSEPILHMSERKDSLDVMYEMNMQKLLQHPVVVEVLNLVYEGKYSVSSSSLSMSQTFQCTLEMDTLSLKSINERLIQNVVTFGDTGSQKQTSLQYNIWKQSIQQRQYDEMFFTTLISFILLYISIQINLRVNEDFVNDRKYFGTDIGRSMHLFFGADKQTLTDYCVSNCAVWFDLYKNITQFYYVIIIMTIGMFASLCQKILVYRVKDNVTLQYSQIGLESTVFATGALYILSFNAAITTTDVSETCGPVNPAFESAEFLYANDKVFSLLGPGPGDIDFKLVVSTLVVQLVALSIIMLQRTQYLGELIMMLDQMKNELSRFFITFGLIILVFLLLGRMLSTEFKYEPASFFQAFLDLFNAFNGNIVFDAWTVPIGEIYIVIFMYLFKILLISLLAAMFINRYKTVYVNLDAYKRFTIIKLKNSVSFDKFIGGVTLTFFPINIIMLPFSVILTSLRSKRASDILLKVQYSIMMVLYSMIAGILFIPMAPILVFKIYANSLYIFATNTRENYKGENIVQLIITLFFGPILMILSIVVDLISLPNVLLKDSKGFEHKYQLSADRLNDIQIDVVMVTFIKIFYGQAWHSKFKGTYMTLIQLMQMHRKIFSLIENLHDLTCKGNKDYKEALSNVQDYNMTKILTRQCSIPDVNGDYKESRCDLNTIYAVQMDIELYNFIDTTLRKFRMGILREEISNKERGIVHDAEKADVNGGAEVDDDDDELKKIEGVNAILIGPDGAPLKRNNSDVMNNFFINSSVRTFTEIEKQIGNQNSQDTRVVAKFKAEIEKKKQDWEDKCLNEFKKQSGNYNSYINESLGIESTVDAQVKSQNSGKEKTASTHSSKDKEGK